MKDIKEIEKIVDKLNLSPQKKRRKRGISRKMAIATAIVVSCFVITASAALLSYYGQITTTAGVSQSVMVDGNSWDEPLSHDFAISAGCTKLYKHKIENTASVEAEIEIKTKGDLDGIDVEYYIMDGWKTLELENKDPNDWTIKDEDGIYANVTYNPCCPTFKGTIDVYGLDDGIKYALIYYADQQDRFDNWGGDPLKVIKTFTGDGTYDFDINLAGHLPMEGDWNIGPDADYTSNEYGDNYLHGKGAKLWIIPFDDINGIRDNTIWNPEKYLFETDLIAYFDCNINPIPEYLYPYFEYETPITDTTYTLDPGEEICLFISYNFDVALYPGDYTVTTKIKPVTT